MTLRKILGLKHKEGQNFEGLPLVWSDPDREEVEVKLPIMVNTFCDFFGLSMSEVMGNRMIINRQVSAPTATQRNWSVSMFSRIKEKFMRVYSRFNTERLRATPGRSRRAVSGARGQGHSQEREFPFDP